MMAAELLNTAIECLCDRVTTGYDEAVGRAKDIAAAAVFLCALFCVVIGGVFFLHSGALVQAVQVLAESLWKLALLLLSFPAAVWFVFFYGRRAFLILRDK